MDPNKQNRSHRDYQDDANLPESITSSETSFGSFIVPEPENEVEGGYAPPPPAVNAQLFLPDEGICAANMLNLEIAAHAHTEMALRMETIRASRLERHYTHQSVALAAWQNAYQDCLAKTQSQAEEIARLKQEVEEYKAANRQLLERTGSWRDTARPASA